MGLWIDLENQWLNHWLLTDIHHEKNYETGFMLGTIYAGVVLRGSGNLPPLENIIGEERFYPRDVIPTVAEML